ncbi:hypothetical protein PN498_06795 [Oscillatoria sp. CS-180]|uniref:glutaredoxin family protein n=1 Tax=Oscillatoria sp. CS-180 TaxID=3021720 RepID=UPI0023305883|nr:hypothetical protein [Oscillatoria sp. CS-180]MDB9525689.1 hypothetical protein [Oscillatoria sp. CS-180]
MTQAHRFFSKQRSSLLKLTGTVAIAGVVAAGCASVADSTSANSYESQLAAHLTEQGATMYGAYWCPHCADQKEMFGEAVQDIPYVECAADGKNAQPELCKSKNIQGYPTWEIDGEFYIGAQPLAELARLSGFEQ